jgi:hypothetical protein
MGHAARRWPATPIGPVYPSAIAHPGALSSIDCSLTPERDPRDRSVVHSRFEDFPLNGPYGVVDSSSVPDDRSGWEAALALFSGDVAPDAIWSHKSLLAKNER